MKEKIIKIAPILLIIVIAVLAIAALVSLSQSLFGEDQNPTVKLEQDSSTQSLLSSRAGRSVKMTVRGPIVASENFRSYVVEVSPTARRLTTYKGYVEEAIDNVVLENNVKSYEEFVYALHKANMVLGKSLTGDADDLRGVCASGHIYDFAILDEGKTEKHLWTSTCAGSKGSLKANVAQLQNLFISQIPNNNKIVKDLGVGKK